MLVALARWWSLRRKRAAVTRYATELARALYADYGAEVGYAVPRIRAAIRRHGLSITWERYAMAMFSTHEAFVEAFVLAGVSNRANVTKIYDELRHEAASLATHGRQSFIYRVPEEIKMDNGDSQDAARRWGIGLR